MTQDQNKKTLRHFQCRDYLWEIFEQMSNELECSTDYLINEAMRQYARSRNYGSSQRPASMETQTMANNAAYPIPSIRSQGAAGAPPNARPQVPPPPPPRRPTAPPTAPPATGAGRPSMAPPPPPPGRPLHSAPPPLPGGVHTSAQPGRPALYLVFNGQKIPINKDEFVIGRGSKSADLPIKDGNISRRHAAVVFHNGSYFIKDLGSTNGVEFAGRRLESRRIEEGDLYRLCDYEIQFTYH